MVPSRFWNCDGSCCARKFAVEFVSASAPVLILVKASTARPTTAAVKTTQSTVTAPSSSVQKVWNDFSRYLSSHSTWYSKAAKDASSPRIAYFSAEFGFHETLPIAAGGLGMLAADHAKSASDLGLGLVGVSLFLLSCLVLWKEWNQTVEQQGW